MFLDAADVFKIFGNVFLLISGTNVRCRYSLCCFESLEENFFYFQFFHVMLNFSASSLPQAFSESFGFQSVTTFLLVHYMEYFYNLQFFLVFSEFFLSSSLASALKHSEIFYFCCFCLSCGCCLYDTIFSFIDIHEHCCHVIKYKRFRLCGYVTRIIET